MRSGMGSARLRSSATTCLEAGGQRIWAVVFTLYPDGRFDVEYDYNKPENYDEADELVAGE